MTTRIAPNVQIETRIQQDADLYQSVLDTTDFLDAQAVDVPPPSSIRWDFADRDGKLLQLTLTDGDDDTGPSVRRNLSTKWIRDSVNRKIAVLQVWSELLSKRSDRRMSRISELLARLQEEEADGEDSGPGRE